MRLLTAVSLVRVQLGELWLRGQAVKTSPFHGGNTGSIPVGVIWRHSQVVRQRSATPLSPVQIRVAPLRKPWKFIFPGLIFSIKMYLLKTVKTDFWKIGQHQERMLSDRSGSFFRKQDSFTIINQMKVHGILSTQSVMLCYGSSLYRNPFYAYRRDQCEKP